MSKYKQYRPASSPFSSLWWHTCLIAKSFNSLCDLDRDCLNPASLGQDILPSQPLPLVQEAKKIEENKGVENNTAETATALPNYNQILKKPVHVGKAFHVQEIYFVCHNSTLNSRKKGVFEDLCVCVGRVGAVSVCLQSSTQGIFEHIVLSVYVIQVSSSPTCSVSSWDNMYWFAHVFLLSKKWH